MLDGGWADADGLHVVRNSDLSVLHNIPSGMDLGLSTSQYPPSPAYTPFETSDYESTSSYMITNGDNSAAYEPLFPMFGSLVPMSNTNFTNDEGTSIPQYLPSPVLTPFQTFDHESTSSPMITNNDNPVVHERLFPMFDSLVPMKDTDFTSAIS
jgi:hypothetical protein